MDKVEESENEAFEAGFLAGWMSGRYEQHDDGGDALRDEFSISTCPGIAHGGGELASSPT